MKRPSRGCAAVRTGGLAVWIAVLLLACSGSVSPTAPETEPLRASLVTLPGVDADEAARLASAALEATDSLRREYRPLSPPVLGNLAVHLGLRERGLCCHWVQDLLRALASLELESLRLHWGVAHHGNWLREHSSVIVVPSAGGFADGLVLDAWRGAGRLRWQRVDADRYPWRLHPSDAVRERLVCREDLR